MASFLENIEPFRGTGERNKDGQTLEEFLEGYQPYRYETPSCTTDAVVFSYRGMEEQIRDVNALEVLLVKRSNHPSIGFWALPGGFINLREDLEETARRELQEETGVSGLCMEQIAVYGAMDRDPRTRVITTAYMALVKKSPSRPGTMRLMLRGVRSNCLAWRNRGMETQVCKSISFSCLMKRNRLTQLQL